MARRSRCAIGSLLCVAVGRAGVFSAAAPGVFSAAAAGVSMINPAVMAADPASRVRRVVVMPFDSARADGAVGTATVTNVPAIRAHP
ncbi:hypothetical protein GCM10010168_30460 [Actinoplanes ianthinogenes]|uniref:Uncharacterized protein n=1 Tax=Actinoplanes ianthinogenes TaxID=122358 RepID=A0ABM7LLP0_9ACTN|nr:hypothetical protein Aiant_08450 [Actinoplanes ianthinogenes]GGR10844.1 hypothetical protein GCM10010168_30460 [Actinoplanes ianthinogenes]